MQPHELISRAILKAKGRNPKEFFGLSLTDARELIVLAHHCDNELGLKMSAFGPDAVSGVRLELSGKGKTYEVRVTPLGKVTLSGGPSGNQKQLFQAGHFNHLVGGQLFRAIQSEEKQKPWLK